MRKRAAGPFERFSEPARRAVVLAAHYARRYDTADVGLVHLLLGLCDVSGDRVATALESVGVTAISIQAMFGAPTVSELVEPPPPHLRRLIWDKQVKEAFSEANEEADRRPDVFVGTEHLLLGLLNVRRNPATAILRDSGDDLHALRRMVDTSSRSRQDSSGGS